MSTINLRIRTLFATLSAMTTANTVLLEGEEWIEKDADTGQSTGRRKVGDGTTAFNDLPFEPSAGGAGATDLSIANRGASTLDIASSTGADVTVPAATTSLSGVMTAADKTKLDGIASSATANATDAQLRDRSTHTGTQAWGTIAGTPTTLGGYGITDAQPLDTDLTSIAALTTASYGRSLLTQTSAENAIENLLYGGAGSPLVWNGAFAGGNGGAGISTTINNTASSATAPNFGAGPSTGTTSTGACGYFCNTGVSGFATNPGKYTLAALRRLRMSVVLRIPTLSDGTETFVVHVGGYGNNPDATRITAGALISGSTITATATNGGVETSSVSTLTLTQNEWTRFDVSWDGTTISVSVNGSAPLTVSSGLPTATMGWGVVIAKRAGITSRNVNIAYGFSALAWLAVP